MAVVSPARRRPRAAGGTTGVREKLLLFRVGDGTYGVSLGGLWEVLLPEGITTVPTPPYQVCTALAYRGTRLPLIRLSELFASPSPTVPPTARVLLARGSGQPIGLLADDVLEVAEVDASRIQPFPALATTLRREFFRGVVVWRGRIIFVIDDRALAGFDEVVRFYADSTPAG
jgi:purine-binding chemotaxis protein CheW